nr:VanW family protein [Arcanobacterium pluranimalium]
MTTAVATVDDKKLDTALDAAIAQLKVDPVEPSITFDSAKASVVTTKAKNGVSIDRGQAASHVREHWFDASDKIVLPSKSMPPHVSDDQIAAFVKNEVDPVISKPVSVVIREKVIDLEPRDLGGLLVFEAKSGKPVLSINKAALKDCLRARSGGILKDPVDARIEIVNHTTPTVIPAQPGEVIDLDKLSQELLNIGKQSDRTVKPQIVQGEPEFTTEQAQKMGVKEVVSEFSTPITSDPVRTTNLRVGSQKVSNRVIKPGEDFNLEQLLGEISTAQGFVSSGVLVDGFGSEAVGGGLSQLSTNTFNIGYRAGMVDVQHRPHTQYYSRYPAGLESTLWSGQINMIWKNNTPYGAVVDSYVADGRLVTRLWSTKHWDVQVWSGPRQNLVPATTEVNKKKDCTPYGPGNPGFTITVGRKVSLNGQIHEDSTLTWRYNPQNGATCQ